MQPVPVAFPPLQIRMALSLQHISDRTRPGANLIADGATFRIWAPNALEVYVCGDFTSWEPEESNRLTAIGGGNWAGFVPGAEEFQTYKFYVVGEGSEGFKRDPYARELDPGFTVCILRSPDFPWHDADWRTPPFHEFIIYQLHVGAFYAPHWNAKAGTFLDVVDKLEYLVDLGVTAVQLLPVVEFPSTFSLGYNGLDYFSPEMDFGQNDERLAPYVDRINQLLDKKGAPAYHEDDLRTEVNQLKALVDLFHLYGVAVIFDVVYNHAGGGFGDESLYFLDRQEGQHEGIRANSLYFSDRDHAGGFVFDFGKPEVRQLLIDNAVFYLEEYHVDGFRYDQVSVIDHDGAPHGWRFCQDLSSTVRFIKPDALQKAEYWPVNSYVVRSTREGGAGFDTALTDGLRIAIRNAVGQAAAGNDHPVDMTAIANNLWPPGFSTSWSFVQGPENHDLVLKDRQPRIARLADSSNARSWYARSRSRVALGISATAPGIPMLFMGQEFLEDKPWSDNLDNDSNLLIYWDGLRVDRHMGDFYRFTSDLLHLRRRLPALTGEGFRCSYVHDADRVLAFHRWVPGEGRDVLVVAHLSESTRYGYRIGLPFAGRWLEVFNSDVYDHYVNPQVAGNGGEIFADPWPLHGFDASAEVVLPACSVLVFASEGA